MSRFLIKTVSLVLMTGAVGVGAATPPHALQPLQRVEVAGQALPVRTDVLQACPDVTAQLTVGLARALSRTGGSADMVVRFDIREGAVDQVQTQGHWNPYRGAVRQAMQNVQCEAASVARAPQRFAFRLAIRPESDEGKDTNRVALTALPVAAAVALY
ncbi:hypothetical protein [Inhella gelatinilytica]|uniref:Uncharacterized protein n=1 Tax=Inhella gelatinilytica TaxID=2795030 RepID=A0A931IT10_9BURK|nr:hypothetical protein [Inhella gelatinilytica]MBH9551457.1 hypothetical protein [Inhella gelatinilytica]